MIIQQLSNTISIGDVLGMSVKTVANALPVISDTPVVDFCYCGFECDYTINVFADLSSDDYWENDSDTFMFRRYIPSDTVDLELLRDGVVIDTITDNTYGELFDGFSSGNPEQQLYYGFRVDWKNVMILHGVGRYTIKASLNILGDISDFESVTYYLLPYSAENAQDSVRIETYQNGNIRSSEFDFTGLNWYQSYRIKGKFFDKQPTLEVDNYVTQDYIVEQIQDKIVNEYTLETHLLPQNIGDFLIYNNILSNEFLITDYGLFNPNVYRRLSVQASAIDESVEYSRNRRKKYVIKFTDRKDNIIKHNF